MDSLLLADISNNMICHCECGNDLRIELGVWKLNIIGAFQFRCPCGKVTTWPAGALWTDESAKEGE